MWRGDWNLLLQQDGRLAMNTKLRYLCVAVCASLALVGCAPGDSASAPASNDSNQPVVEDSTSSEETGTSAQEQDGPILSDEDVMATMTCEVLTEDQLSVLGVFGTFDRGARVEIGESNGATWWAVVLEVVGDDGTVDARSSFITKSATLDDFSDDTWIELPSENTWQNVDWGHDMLVRGQSALTLARRTLAAS